MSNFLNEKEQFHLKIKPGDVGKYIILCGDPSRVEKIASFFDNPEFLVQNREYTIYNGMLSGQKVSTVSTGIGGPSTAICVEELIKCGAHTFIRVGTSGGIKSDVTAGDLVIATAAVRDDGTSAEYMHASYPAAASYSVVNALAEEANTLCDAAKYHVGVVQSKDSFYGELEPDSMAISHELNSRWSSYVKLGCLASEMECAALFSVAQTRGVSAGAVLLSIWNANAIQTQTKAVYMDTTLAIRCGVGALKRLIES